MTDLPSGIVTFLFTDIEGSTPLWERDPDAMRQSLELHDAVLNAAIRSHGGIAYKFIGDAFQAAFSYPEQALHAAIAIQRGLSAASWGSTGALRVRIGLHTGPAEIQGSEYVSHTLNRVARVMSAAHGGQILLTSAVKEMIHGNLTDDVSLRDMGQLHLKGMLQPEHLFQVVARSLTADFPPLIGFDTSPHNLPLELTSFIGREREIEAVDRLLKDARLVTLTGSGGVGKTRLAIEVGQRAIPLYSDGVWLVELAPLMDPQLVPQAIADVLRIRDTQDRPLMDTLKDYLRDKRSLLIFDNCEHLLDACTRMADRLLRSCPRLNILASSREALGLAGEQPFLVPNLSLPENGNLSLDQFSQYEALQLFTARAQTALPGFHLSSENMDAAVQICRRLDGIPLAIELAAARIKTLRIDQIAQRLDDRFRLLTGGSRTALPRQQTLRATIDWSYGLLSQAERHFLEHLSVFSGGCTLEAAEAICSGEEIPDMDILDLLTSLVNKSMVALDREQGREPHFNLLETIRQYAREKLLESGEIAALRDRHLSYYLDLAEKADPQTRGPDQVVWLEKLDREYDNLLAALEWSNERDAEAGLRLAGALGYFLWIRNKYQEGLRWLTSFLGHPQNETRNRSRAYALGRLAFSRLFLIAPSISEKSALESLSISRELGDHSIVAFALYLLGWISYQRKNDYAAARVFFDESLSIYQSLGDQWGLARIYLNIGNMEGFQGHISSQKEYLERSLAACRQAGDQRGMAIALNNLAFVLAEAECDLRGGRKMAEESIDLYQQLKAYGDIDNALLVYGFILCLQGEYPYARAIYQELEDIDRRRGEPLSIIESQICLGDLDRLEGKFEAAAATFGDHLAQLRTLFSDNKQDSWYITELLTDLGVTLIHLGDFSRAKSLLEEALTNARLPIERAMTLQGLGLLATTQGDGKSAAEHFLQSLQILRESSYRIYAIAALEDYAGALHLLAQDNQAARILGTMAAVRGQIGAPRPPGDRPRYERLLTDLKTELGETGFDQAWNEGQAMIRQRTPDTVKQSLENPRGMASTKTPGTALDEALAYALEDTA